MDLIYALFWDSLATVDDVLGFDGNAISRRSYRPRQRRLFLVTFIAFMYGFLYSHPFLVFDDLELVDFLDVLLCICLVASRSIDA